MSHLEYVLCLYYILMYYVLSKSVLRIYIDILCIKYKHSEANLLLYIHIGFSFVDEYKKIRRCTGRVCTL